MAQVKQRKVKCVVPEWAQDAVWYQIFPERFRNGCPASNPRLSDITDHKVPGWKVTPWGRDWYAPDSWVKDHGHRYAIFARRYGGDLVGIIEKLDYLQELGVNALYLNPVFTARSMHKYDAATFHHVDPTFGPDRAGDLKALAAAQETEDPATWIWTAADRCLLDLIREVHARGMRIILDGVFNHTGREFFAFADILKRGRESRYADWFLIKKWNPDGSPVYDGWFGHHSLPEFNRTDDDLLPPVRQYVFDITRRWMDPDGDGDLSKGIDGWRLDVAFCVPHGFWRAWRKHVKSINPEAYVTAEIVADAREYVQGDQFDAVMNYMWLYPSVAYFRPQKRPLAMSTFKRRLDRLREAYPEPVTPVLQNLLDSHDVGRVVSMLENAELPIKDWEDYFHVARVKQSPTFRTRRPSPATWQALRQLVIFQMTYPGAPMLYYGTEVGMWGANDPDNRQPMLWDDIRYEPEAHGPGGQPLDTRTPRAPDHELFAFFQQAIRLRHDHIALRRGGFEWFATGRPRLLGLLRTHKKERILTLLNTSDKDIRYTSSPAGKDLWYTPGQRLKAGELTVPARGWQILAL